MQTRNKLIVCLEKDITFNMKKLYIIILFVFICVNGFAQTTKPFQLDTNDLCIPYPVAKQILIDLNDYDRLKEVVVTYKNEIYELNNNGCQYQIINKIDIDYNNYDLEHDIIIIFLNPQFLKTHKNIYDEFIKISNNFKYKIVVLLYFCFKKKGKNIQFDLQPSAYEFG